MLHGVGVRVPSAAHKCLFDWVRALFLFVGCSYLCVLVKVMSKMIYTGIYILLTVLLLLAACTGKLTEGKVVTVTIETQRFFAERIAGDKFVVHCVVPSGQSPETYDPTPKQMGQI